MAWWFLVGLLGLLVCDRLLLGAESRGWIYYRRNRPPAGAAGTGVLTVMSIYQPGHERIVDERFRIAVKIEEVGDDEPLGWLPSLPGTREPTGVG